MAVFQVEVSVDCDPETAMDFLKRPENLLKISPPDMNLAFLSAPELFESGSQFEFQVTGFGQTQKATHQISSMSEYAFTETQTKGAMRKFVAHHHCQPGDCGGTIITERIEFEPPGGLLGLVATAERIQAHMEKAFEYRHQMMQQLLRA